MVRRQNVTNVKRPAFDSIAPISRRGNFQEGPCTNGRLIHSMIGKYAATI